MTDLYIIRGLPGSGKTTFAKMLREALPSPTAHVEADMFMLDAQGNYAFNPHRLSECHQKCISEARECLESGSSVIVSNTFIRRWEMQPYLDMANELDARVTVLTVEADHGNVHGVSAVKIAQMRSNWEDYK